MFPLSFPVCSNGADVPAGGAADGGKKRKSLPLLRELGRSGGGILFRES